MWTISESTRMFLKSRSAASVPSLLATNSIDPFYDIRDQTATAGPENVWQVYKASCKDDRKEVSIFLLDKKSIEKMLKSNKMQLEMFLKGARKLELLPRPRFLQVLKIGHCNDTLAFSAEPILGSLANVLAYQDLQAKTRAQSTSTNPKQYSNVPQHGREGFYNNYELLPIEIKYGLHQITGALQYLHETNMTLHRNVCPTSIMITSRGTWKLAGFEFTEEVSTSNNANGRIQVNPWTHKISKVLQPNLDYIAPEVQQNRTAGFYSDMYSLGMTICAIFNDGRPLIQANSNSEYMKQTENLHSVILPVIEKMPQLLQQPVTKLLAENPQQRPTANNFLTIDYFRDEVVEALVFLDGIKMTSIQGKKDFFRNTLTNSLRNIPKKLWYQHIWAYLQIELETQEVLSDALQPVLYIVKNSSEQEYLDTIFPALKHLLATRKTIQSTVTLLENLHVILMTTPLTYIESDMLKIFYEALDSPNIQVQTAAFVAMPKITDFLDEKTIRNVVLPRLLQAFTQKNSMETRILIHVIPHILLRLEKHNIIDDILPLLCNKELVNLQQTEVLECVLEIYNSMLENRQIGIPIDWMANRALPSLLPQTVNPNLNLDQFRLLFKLLQTMLGHIEKHQSNKLILNNLPVQSSERSFRHQYSTNNVYISATNIPNVRIEHRKTSSAEDMARNSILTTSTESMPRKNSFTSVLDKWLIRTRYSNNSLSVVNPFTDRRLSDNTLTTSKNIVTQSCASSPGAGFSIRRHSAQERQNSGMNLSPHVDGIPTTSTSVPFLYSTDMGSLQGSRRPSVSSTSSHPGAVFLRFASDFFNKHAN